ncbi:MAG: hypothetical protein JXA91_03320 [Candidatus Thermoplasmatota archaeon]|nr:hypothetical protein [Candidatus Thermoplasmatota archaeon]
MKSGSESVSYYVLPALEQEVKGLWFILIDKISSMKTFCSVFAEVDGNNGIPELETTPVHFLKYLNFE